MSLYLKVIGIVILIVVGGGAALLLTWDIPPPEGPIEKVLSNDRFPS